MKTSSWKAPRPQSGLEYVGGKNSRHDVSEDAHLFFLSVVSRRHSHRLQLSHQSARYYSFDTSDHSRCFHFGRQPAVWRELIDQGRQMLTETGEQILTFHARLFA